MATTAGMVVGTPLLFQALTGTATSGARPSSVTAFAATALVFGGLGGLLALAFDPTDLIALVVAVCLGLAGGALHPELLAAINND